MYLVLIGNLNELAFNWTLRDTLVLLSDASIPFRRVSEIPR